MQQIFLTPGRREEWREQIAAEDPAALSILKALRRDASPLEGPPASQTERDRRMDGALAGLGLAWLEEDAPAAEESRARLCEVLDEAPGSDLGKAARALAAVLAWDFGAGLWEKGPRRAFAGRVADMARSFLEVTRGNPHAVTNNWWMLTHGGCLLAALAVDGEEGPAGALDLSDLKMWALERFRAFCAVFGNAGLYHEGSGYIAYTLSMLMPTLVAVEKHLDPGILEDFPQMRRSIASMVTGTAAFRHRDSGSEEDTCGASLQWNDAGRSCLGLNPFIPGMTLAPTAWKGALRTVFDRLLGVEAGNLWRCSYRGLPLAVVMYPFSTTPEDPEGVLPKSVWDQRQGLGMWRSQWGDGRESVFGWYARSTHVGGHHQDDAASIRLMANGRTWICGGGQARAKACWQSVFTHADDDNRPRPAPFAYLFCSHLAEEGGVVGIDTRQSLGAYSERYLAWRADLGLPFVLAVLDQLDDHRNPPLDWQWNLSFPRDLECAIDEDGAGFVLAGTGHGMLSARFLLDRPGCLEAREMPGSSRTYANGNTVNYPGDGYIRAAYNGVKEARILVCLAVLPEGAGRPEIHFRRNSIAIGGREWAHPFSPAILKSVDLAKSVPNRMTLPGG